MPMQGQGGWGAPAPGYPVQGYPVQGYPVQGYPGYGAPRPANPHDTPSLVLGLLTFLLGPLTGIPAIILGVKGRRYARQNGVGGGASLFGVIIGSLSLVGTALLAGLLALGFSSGTFQELDRELEFESRVEAEIGEVSPLLEGALVYCDEVPEVLEVGDRIQCRAEFDLLTGGSDEAEIEVTVLPGDELEIEVLDPEDLGS